MSLICSIYSVYLYFTKKIIFQYLKLANGPACIQYLVFIHRLFLFRVKALVWTTVISLWNFIFLHFTISYGRVYLNKAVINTRHLCLKDSYVGDIKQCSWVSQINNNWITSEKAIYLLHVKLSVVSLNLLKNLSKKLYPHCLVLVGFQWWFT